MKKEFLTALVLAIGFVFVGCESPTNGSNGGNGTNALPAATATTAAGAEKFFAEGHGVVYFAGALVLGDGGEDSLTIPDGKTLILADVADLQGRAVASDGKGSITVKAGGTLNVGTTDAATLVVGGGSKIVVNDGTVAVPGASALVFAKGAVLQQTGGTLAATSATFAFEDPDDLSDNALAAVTGSGADSLNIGGTLDVATGAVSGGTTSAPADTVLVPTTPAWPLVLTGKTLVIATGKTVASTSGGTTLKPGTYKFTNTSSLTADGVLTIGDSLEGTPDIEVADQTKLTQADAAKLKAGTVTYTGNTAFSGVFTPDPDGLVTYNFKGTLATGSTGAIGPTNNTLTFSADTTLAAGAVLTADGANSDKTTLTLGTGTTALGANTITLAGTTTTLNIPGTLTVTQSGSMWAAFPSGVGKVVVTGSIEQATGFGIGTGREFELGTGGSITYEVATPAVTIGGAVTAYAKGTDNALEWTKPHTVASGTLTIGGDAVLKSGSTLTVDTGATLLVPASTTLTVAASAKLTVAASGNLNVNGTLALLETSIAESADTYGGNSGTITVGATGAITEKFADGSSWYWRTGTAKVVVNGGATWTVNPAGGGVTIIKVGAADSNSVLALAAGSVLTLTEQANAGGNDFVLVGNATVTPNLGGGGLIVRSFIVGNGTTSTTVTLATGSVVGKPDCTFTNDPNGITGATSAIIFKKNSKVTVSTGSNNFYASGEAESAAAPDNSSGSADVVYRWVADGTKWVVGTL